MLKILIVSICFTASFAGIALGTDPIPPTTLDCQELPEPTGLNDCQVAKGVYVRPAIDKRVHVWGECKKVRSDYRYFIGAKNSQEWVSFKTWAQTHPDKVTITPCD